MKTNRTKPCKTAQSTPSGHPDLHAERVKVSRKSVSCPVTDKTYLQLRPMLQVRLHPHDYLPLLKAFLGIFAPQSPDEHERVEELASQWLQLDRIRRYKKSAEETASMYRQLKRKMPDHEKALRELNKIATALETGTPFHYTGTRAEFLSAMIVEAGYGLFEDSITWYLDPSEEIDSYPFMVAGFERRIGIHSLGASDVQTVIDFLGQAEPVEPAERHCWALLVRAAIQLHRINLYSVELLSRYDAATQRAIVAKKTQLETLQESRRNQGKPPLAGRESTAGDTSQERSPAAIT